MKTLDKHKERADGFLKKGDVNNALKYYIEGSKKFPDSYGCFTGIGLCLYLKGGTEFAIENLKKSVSMQPYDTGNSMILVHILLQKGMDQEAFAYFSGIDSISVHHMGLKPYYDIYSLYFKEQGFEFKAESEQKPAEKMGKIVDSLTEYFIEKGKITKDQVPDFSGADLEAIVHYIVEDSAKTGYTLTKEGLEGFEKSHPGLLAKISKSVS